MPTRAELDARFLKEDRVTEVRLTNTTGNHNKFYEMWITKVEVRSPTITNYVLLKWWGRIKTGGQMDTEDFPSHLAALNALEKVKRSKLAKGYVLDTTLPPASSIKERIKERVKKARENEIPSGTTFAEDAESEAFNAVSAKRKEDASW